MLSRPRRVILVSIVALVFVCVFLCANAGNILDGLCKEDTAIADLDAGSNRHIIITGQSCWEVGRGLHYEVKDGGRIVSPKSLYDVDEGNSHTYSLIYADNKSLVGVIEMTRKQSRILAIYDFNSGNTYPRPKDDEVGVEETVQQRWRGLFQRLHQENPQIPIPSEYQQKCFPTIDCSQF